MGLTVSRVGKSPDFTFLPEFLSHLQWPWTSHKRQGIIIIKLYWAAVQEYQKTQILKQKVNIKTVFRLNKISGQKQINIKNCIKYV